MSKEETTMNTENLTSWPPGTSGNPSGRPAGSRNLRKVVSDILDDRTTFDKLPKNLAKLSKKTDTPLEAIVIVLVGKALEGDLKASDTLLRYSIPKELDPEDTELPGFFNTPKLQIEIVKPQHDFGNKSE